MICELCRRGQHKHCNLAECDCPQRREEEQVEEVISRRSDEVRADMVYQALGTSSICADDGRGRCEEGAGVHSRGADGEAGDVQLIETTTFIPPAAICETLCTA